MRYGTGVALVLGAGVLWSLQGLIVRQIGQASAVEVQFWRAAGTVPVLLGWSVLTGRAAVGRASLWQRIVSVGGVGAIGAVALAAAFFGAIHAFQTLTVANAVFLFSTSPVFAALLGWGLLRERVRPATWAAIALAGVGIVVMLQGGFAAGRMGGSLAALVAGAGFAVFTVCLRWGRLSDMMPVAMLAGALSLVVALAVGGPQAMIAVPARDAALAALMGAVALAGGMILYTLGSRVVPAAEATLLSLIEVMLGPLWVWMLLGETASGATLTGGAILLVAVALNAVSGLRRTARPARVTP